MTRSTIPWILATMALATCASVACLVLPRPLPVDAPPDRFSALRAMQHVEAMAREPHPTGSPAQAEVREYLLRQLAALGVEPHLQRSIGLTPEFDVSGSVARVENIVARLEGSGARDAILLVAHYDSAPGSPGAADNGTGVAVVLEVLRALRTGRALANDLVVLLTDAEEWGMLGARAFVAEHPWQADVRAVLNFEAAAAGPALPVRAGPGTGRLLDRLRGLPTYSWTGSLFDLSRLDTDLTPFLEAGLPGLDLYAPDAGLFYHTSRDLSRHVDPRSVQQAGSHALTLVRRLGDLDLDGPPGPETVHFTLLPEVLVRYPAAWAPALGLATGLAFAGVALAGRRRRRLTAAGASWGLLAFIAAASAAALLAVVAWSVVRAVRPPANPVFLRTPNDGLYLLGFLALAIALVAAVLRLARRRIALADLAAGALAPWAGLAVLSGLLWPAVSYLFAWPLLAALPGLAGAGRERTLLVAGPAAVALLWTPPIYLVFVGTRLLLLPGLVVALALVLGILVVPLQRLWERRSTSVLAALAGLGLLMAAGLTGGSTPDRPRANQVIYLLPAGRQEAFWVVPRGPIDDWQARFLGETPVEVRLGDLLPAMGDVALPAGPAPLVDLPPPEVTFRKDATRGGERLVTIQIVSRRQAPVVVVYLEGPALAEVKVDGREIPCVRPVAGWRALSYVAPPAEGFELALRLAAGPLRLVVADLTPGLPDVWGNSPRPESMMSLGDTTVVVGETVAR